MLHFSRVQPPEPQTITLDMDKELASKMNDWRMAQRPQTFSPTEAIYELLRRALTAEGFMSSQPDKVENNAQVEAMVRAFQSAIQNPTSVAS